MRHATDCTVITDGKTGEVCYEQDADQLYACEPTSGDCNTAAEWRPLGNEYLDVSKLGATCDHTVDATSILTTAFAAANTVFIPSGCKLLLATPGAGNAALSLGNGKHIVCADQTAGFWLASRRCSTGKYAGSWCTADSDCNYCSSGCSGSTCTYDTGSSVFAPTGGSTYTAIRIDNNVAGASISRCGFFTNGLNNHLKCDGGTNVNKPCRQHCVGGSAAGHNCTLDSDCAGGGTCTNPDCSLGASTNKCKDAATTHPSGDGKINIVDTASQASAHSVVLRDLMVFDLAQSASAITVPMRSRVDNLRMDCTRDLIQGTNTLCWPGLTGSPTVIITGTPTLAIDTGVTLGGESLLSDSYIVATTTGVSAANGSGTGLTMVRGNQIPSPMIVTGAFPFATPTTGVSAGAFADVRQNIVSAGTTGVTTGTDCLVHDNVIAAANAVATTDRSSVVGNTITGGTAGGGYAVQGGTKLLVDGNKITAATRGSIGVRVTGQLGRITNNYIQAWRGVQMVPSGGINNTVANNTFFGGAGAKIWLTGAGHRVLGNYIAWDSGDGGLCAGGANVDLPCTVAGNPNCPSSSCTPEPVIWLGSPDHGASTSSFVAGVAHVIINDNEIHSDNSVALIKLADTGKQCAGGSHVGKTCTTDGNCPSSTCVVIASNTVDIVGNTFLGGSVGVDLSPLNVNHTLDRVFVSSNMFQSGVPTAFSFPTTTTYLSNFQALGNNIGSATKFSNWNWKMGTLQGNTPLLTSDDSAQIAWLKNNDASLTQGDCVEIDSGADNQFKRCLANSTVAVGVALDQPASGSVGQVMVSGIGYCNLDASNAVSRGDRLIAHDTTAGRFRSLPATTAVYQAIAIALTANAGGVTTGCPGGVPCVRCFVAPQPGRIPGNIHSVAWFFPGTPTAGLQVARAVIPEELTGCTSTNASMVVQTTSASTSSFNVNRCTANCTGTSAPTWTKIYSSDTTLPANDQHVLAGVPNMTTLNAGDQFRASVDTVGPGLSDVTITLSYSCDQ